MCGICGFNSASITDEPTLSAMCDAIAHRGPDGKGMYMSEGIALGHTRLALVDIDGGAQPLIRTVDDHDVAIVFNGEIYNHNELRSHLKSLGWTFNTRCDTEALLIAYLEWGERCLSKLRGMFAFAIWDSRTRELFCARDNFGIKPFYYTNQGNLFIFASESKSILQHPSYKKGVNIEALSNYLCFQFSATSETFFTGIRKLPAAHWLRVSPNGKLELQRYWTPKFSPESSLRDEEAIELIEGAVADSVHFHAQADVPVGSLLSGGVDSSYLACLLRKENAGAQTFSVGFSENKGFYDEVSQASDIAEAIGIENTAMRITEPEWWDAVDNVLEHMDEPLGDPAAMALYYVDKLAATKVKAVLSGEGADELFGGYKIYQAPLESKRLKWLPKNFIRSAEKAAKRLNIRGANYLHRATFGPSNWYYTNANQVAFSPMERRSIMRNSSVCKPPQMITAPLYAQVSGLSEDAQMQYVDMHLWLVEDILLKTDKMAMAHSLESRVPYLDKHIFEVSSILPTDYRVNRKETKVAFRKAAGRSIPASAATREKLGFPVPLCTWLRQDSSREKLARAFASDAARTYFDVRLLFDLLDAHMKGTDNSRRLWIIYAFLTWHRIYFEQ